MWSIYIIGILTVLSFILYNRFNKKKSRLTSRFSILIRLLLKLDKELVIESTGEDDLTLFSSNIRGSITIYITQYYGIISIIIDSSSIEYSSKKKEWIFLDNSNEYLIFNTIVKDLHAFSNTSFDQTLLNKWIDKSNHTVQNIKSTSSFSNYNIAQSFFCIAFSEIEKIDKFQKISQRGSFEILFFNCMITMEKSIVKEQNQLWDELVTLLIFYLENHNLMNQIKDVEKLLEDRVRMYSEQIEQIKSNPDYNYNILYHYFFLKPLSVPKKIQLKIIQSSSLSKTIERSGFSKVILFMIADIEEKLPILQNLFF
jgi:hypothetical protein